MKVKQVVAGADAGFTLAGALLSFLSLLPLAVMSMIACMGLYGQAVSLGPAAFFVLFALNLWMLIGYLGGPGEW